MNAPAPFPRRARRAILAGSIVLWLAALTATHIPGGELPEVQVSDKILHVLGYLALGSALWLVLRAHGAAARRRWVLVPAVASVYAAFDELTQPLVNRNAAFGDWAADVLGAAAAMLLCEAVARIVEARRAASGRQ